MDESTQVLTEQRDAVAGAIGGVILRFGGARYAVDMSSVAEVVPIPRITRLPASPAWLAGVVNWRGRVLAALDLRPLAGAPSAPLPTSARLVVLSEGDIEVGVIADMVPGLLDADPDSLEAMPATVASGIAPLVRGVVNVDGPVAVLDASAVLRLRHQLPGARSGSRAPGQ